MHYYEFRNVRITNGVIVFASPASVPQQPVSSPLEIAPRASIAIDYQTANPGEASALEQCGSAALVGMHVSAAASS